MSDHAETLTPVLIVGGGPIRLALAADLGRLGVPAMEFCRRLGIADEVRDLGFPKDYNLDSVFITHLDGYELGRARSPSLGTFSSSRRRRRARSRRTSFATEIIDTVRGAGLLVAAARGSTRTTEAPRPTLFPHPQRILAA